MLDKANKRSELLKGFMGRDLFIICDSDLAEFKLIDANKVFIISPNNSKSFIIF